MLGNEIRTAIAESDFTKLHTLFKTEKDVERKCILGLLLYSNNSLLGLSYDRETYIHYFAKSLEQFCIKEYNKGVEKKLNDDVVPDLL